MPSLKFGNIFKVSSPNTPKVYYGCFGYSTKIYPKGMPTKMIDHPSYCWFKKISKAGNAKIEVIQDNIEYYNRDDLECILNQVRQQMGGEQIVEKKRKYKMNVDE